MKKLFYTLFLAIFALNLCAEGQYTAYFRFTSNPKEVDISAPNTYEIKRNGSIFVVVVKHQGSGSVYIESTEAIIDDINLTPEENITYIGNTKQANIQMYDFYIYSNIDILDNITSDASSRRQCHFEEFTRVNNDNFQFAYKSSYNYTAFGNAYVGYNKDGKITQAEITSNGDAFYVDGEEIKRFENITYENNDTEGIKDLTLTGTITNNVTISNIDYFQWISCPYNAELSVYIGGEKAIYTYEGNTKDDGTKPAFVLMRYDNNQINPWVDNGSATLVAGVGYILGIDNRGTDGSVIAQYTSVNKINYIKKESSLILGENNGGTTDNINDDNVHLVGSGLFEKPTGCNFGEAKFVHFAIPSTNGSSYSYILAGNLTSSSLDQLKPHSAFFTQLKSAGELNFDNSGNVSQNAPSLKRAMEQQIVVEEYNITLAGADFEEKTTILTDELGTEGYTIGEDFLYFHSSPNGDVENQFYTFDANRTLSFNHRANSTQTIQLGGLVAQDGRFTISLEGINTKATSVILTDNVENTSVDLINENYTFDANSGSLDGRFTVTINYAPGTTVDTDVVTNSNGIIVVNNAKGCTIENLIAGEQVMIFDAMGRLVYNAQADADFVNVTLNAGTYIVRQNNNWAKFVIK